MYGANQIIHAIPFNKPYDLSGDNKGTDWAWGLPPFNTTHYEFVNKKATYWDSKTNSQKEANYNEIWTGGAGTFGGAADRAKGEIGDAGTIEDCLKLLAEGVIRPAVRTSTDHYECCGQWNTNQHMWWCENGPRYNHPYVPYKFEKLETCTRKVQLQVLEDLVLTKKGLRGMGFAWEIPSHLQWLLH